MWVTLFAMLTAASVFLGMVTFSIHAKQTQAVLDAIPDRGAMLTIERPTTQTGQPG